MFIHRKNVDQNLSLLLFPVPLNLVNFTCKNGCKPIDVSDSTTSKNKNLTNKLLKDQWNNINWSEVEISINRLQSRITKAVIQSRWNLIKRLQYLLEHSYYAKVGNSANLL